MRRMVVVCLLLVMVMALAHAEDSARVLAQILAGKGLISSAEMARVENAAPEEAVRLLAAMLREKGLLTTAEMARFDRSPEPRLVPAVLTQAAPAPKPQAPKSAAEAPPVTAQSKFPVTIYGTMLWNSFYNTAATNIQDVPFVTLKRGADPLENFGMTARQSRLGMRYQGPQIGGARLSGQFEFDMFGGKAALPNGVNMDLFRLRLAYGRLDWKNFSLVGGQDWVIFAPLSPVSLASFAIPALSASGNPWSRAPQLRAEFRREMSSGTRLQWQVAALDPDAGDYPAEFRTVRTPGIGEHGRGPAVESRVSLTSHIQDREATIGFSGHYSRGRNVGALAGQNVERAVDSWGVAFDFTLPLHGRFAIAGEAFDGRALGIFIANIGQSVLPVGTRGEHGVESRGGWVQGQFLLAAKWQFNVAYGIDAPDVAELRTGDRSKNQTYMTNLMYKFSPHGTLAWEWRRMLTDYRNQGAANDAADHVNLAIGYVF